MKKNIIIAIAAAACLMLGGCLKSLENEGLADGAKVRGTVVDSGTGAAVHGMRVDVTNYSRQGESTVTAADGSFIVTVSYEQLHEGYVLSFSADSLYAPTSVSLGAIGYGIKEYDVQMVEVDGPELPTLTTDDVSGIMQTSAIGGGTVVDNGRSHIRRRGICWATSQQPTIVNSHTAAGSGDGHFAAALNGLAPGTTYYVRAYAENCKGISYGPQVQFATPSGVPVVSTAAVSDVQQHSFTCGGAVSSPGAGAVTARGICYSATSTQPTINDQHTTDGSGTGSFTSTVNGLQSTTTYHIRAYATNAHGTGYGEVKTVTTF